MIARASDVVARREGASSRSKAPRRAQPSRLLSWLVERATRLWLGWRQLQWKALERWRALRRAARAVPGLRPTVESLEPRLLLSADLAPALTPVVVRKLDLAPAETTLPQHTAQRLNAAAPQQNEPTVTITGPGSVSFEARNGAFVMRISQSTLDTRITLVPGATPVPLAGIEAASDLGSLDIAAASLTGTAQFGGRLGQLKVGAMDGATLRVAGSGEVALDATAVRDSRFIAAAGQLSANVASWLSGTPGASRIEVASLKAFNTAGDANLDVFVSGQGVVGFALGVVKVGGALAGGLWSINGRASSVQAGSTAAGWRANFSSTLAQLATVGDASGQVALGSLQLLQVGGSLRGFTLLVGADLGEDAALGGSGDNADVFRPGTLARMRVTGDVVDSQIFVSIDPVNGVLRDGNDVQIGTPVQRIQELVVGGQLRGSTRIAAPLFPTAVRVGGQTFNPAALSALAATSGDAVAPTITLALANDTGRRNDDALTSDPTVALRVVEAGGTFTLAASLDGGPARSVVAAPQPDGSLRLTAQQLALLAGGPLADGAHVLRVAGTDAAGNRSLPAELAFTLDTQGPTVHEFGLAPASDTDPVGDGRTTAAQVTLEGLTEPGAAIVAFAGSTELASITVGTDGRFSVAGVALAMGANSFRVTATDAAGNQRARDLVVQRDPVVVPDTTPPELSAALVTDSGRSANDGVTSDPTIAGRATDDRAVLQLLAALDQPATGPFTDITTLLGPDGRFTIDAARLQALAGGTLAQGAHVLRLVAVDTAGNRSTPREVAFTLDSVAPTVSSFGLAAESDTAPAGDGRTTAAVVALEGRTEAGASVELLSGGNLLLTRSADASGKFRFADVALALGGNSFVARSTDAAGNQSTRDLTVARDPLVVPDTTPPTVAATLLDDTGRSASDGITRNPGVRGQASDNRSVTQLLAALDPAGPGATLTDITAALQGNGSFTLDAAALAALAGGSLADGPHLLRLQARDAAGNASDPFELAFTLDTRTPDITAFGLAPASDTEPLGDNRTREPVVTLQGVAEAGAEVAMWQGGQLLATTSANGSGAFSFTNVALLIGDNAFSVRSLDAAGNSAERALTVLRDPPIVADTTAPTLTAALANDSGSSASDGLTRDPAVSGRATDNVAVTRLQAALDGGALVDVSSALQPDGRFTLDAARLAALAGGTLADGAHVLRLVASDAAGNASQPFDLAFTLDTAAPTVLAFGLDAASDTAPTGDNRTTASSATLVGRTQAGVTLTLGAGNQVLGSTTAGGDGSFSFGPGIALALGANAFVLELADAAGNLAQSSLTITRDPAGPVDATAPALTLGLARDSGTSASDRLTNDPTVNGQATDAEGVVFLGAVLNPGATPVLTDITARLAADGRFTLDRAALTQLAGGTLADGAYLLRLVARDAAGNATTAELAFTLDTAAPSGASFGIASADRFEGDAARSAAAIVTLRGSAEAGASIQLLGGTAATTPTTNASASGQFQLPGVALRLGDNSVTLVITDAAGNSQQLTRTLTRVQATQPDAVLSWVNVALQAIQADVTDPPVATRNLALVSLAQYDTLAAIEGTPAFLVQRSVAGAVDAQAALATAAHRVLSLAYPGQRAQLDATLAAALAAMADGAAKNNGVALGLAVADAIWALRRNDGSADFDDYPGSTATGRWRPTGPMFEVADHPQWRDVQPFVLASPGALRPAAPPALDSAEYAAGVEEVRRLGDAFSTTRTADQTQQALFWADGMGSYTPPGHWNQIATSVATAKGNSLSANARLFAQLNVALADAAVACWDAKYSYGLWRPETAIQNADTDANAGTQVDAAWRPLLITPPHPEYVSGHSAFSNAAASVLAATFGDATAFTSTSPTLPNVTRSFSSFSAAAAEAGRSRIYGGIHYEFTNQAAATLGNQVAQAVLARFALTRDTQPPAVILADTPAATRGNLALQGQVIDNLAGVRSLQYQLDGGPAVALTLQADGSFSLVTALALDGTADGPHTLTFIAEDAAGNRSTPLERSFTLATRAPQVQLTGLAEGSVVDVASRMAGSITSRVELVSLRYTIGSEPERSIAYDRSNGSFDEALAVARLGVGNHLLRLVARDAAGNETVVTRNLRLVALPPLTITHISPANGASDVGSTFRPQVNFSRPVDKATLTASSFYATGPDGVPLAANIVPSQDGSFAWLFFTEPMPGGSTITLHIEGDLIRAANGGALLDADGNGTAGGAATASFSTVSRTGIPGTTLTGRVVDPGADLQPMTFDDIRRGPDGVIHTPDDVFLNPIAGAKVWVLGQEDRFVFTDAQGRFTLGDVPAGNVKLAIDGRTATNAPAGFFWPEMVMDLTVEPGLPNTVMGSMGQPQEQRANEARGEVYLPRLARGMFEDVVPNQQTVVNVSAQSAPNLTDDQRAQLRLIVEPGSLLDENGNVLAAGQVGISTVPSELVRDMLPPGVLDHAFDITIQAPGVAAFATPLAISFPNTERAAPGSKLNIMSFDHTTGRLVISGTATVSADGLSVTSDPGSGIRAPGWHWLARIGELLRGIGAKVIDWLDDPCVNLTLKSAGVVAGAVGVAATFGVLAPAWGVGAAVTGAGIGIGVILSDGVRGELQLPDLGSSAVSLVDNIGQWLENYGSIKYESLQGTLRTLYSAAKAPGLSLAEEARILAEIKRIDSPINGSLITVGSIKPFGELLGKVAGPLSLALDLSDIPKAFENCFGVGLTDIPRELRAAYDDLSAGISQLDESIERTYRPIQDAVDELIQDRLKAILERYGDGEYWIVPDGKGYWLHDSSGDRVIDPINNLPAYIPTESVLPASLAADTLRLQRLRTLVSDAIGGSRGVVTPGQPVNPTLSLDHAIDSVLSSLTRIVTLFEGMGQSPRPTPTDVRYSIQEVSSGIVIYRGSQDALLTDGVMLGAGRAYVVEAYSMSQRLYGARTIFVPPGNPVADDGYLRSLTRSIGLMPDQSADSDGDGLSDNGERVFGTEGDRADTDGDGVGDAAEIRAGTDPLGLRVLPVGVVGASAIRGVQINSLALAGTTDGSGSQAAFGASNNGLVVFDIADPRVPQVLSQLNLGAPSTAIKFDQTTGAVAIASGAAGLQIVDVRNRTAPRLLLNIPGNFDTVEVREGFAYASTGNEVRAFDMLTGEQVTSLRLDRPVDAMVRDGDRLYVVDNRPTLRVLELGGGGALTARGSVAIPNRAASLTVADGVAYVAVGNGGTGGFLTVDVRDANQPVLLSGVDSNAVAGTAIALTGNGLALVAGSSNFVFGGFRSVDLIDVRDPRDTSRLITRVDLPSVPTDIAIGGGLAFVATGAGGLQVVNYLSADIRRVAPTIDGRFNLLDVDAATPGIQVLEGSTITLRPPVGDDVQVRNVELLRDGRVVANDVGFPFELSTNLPTLAANNGVATVQLQVRATDTGGNIGVSGPVAIQLVRDTIAPTIVSTNVPDGTTKGRSFRAITFTFSEPIDAATLDASSLRLVAPNGQIIAPVNIQWRQQGREVQLTYDPLPVIGEYRVVIDQARIRDRAGNAMGVGERSTEFTLRSYSAEWVGQAGGFWDAPANWSGGVVPGVNDDVFIGLAPGQSITFRSGNVTVATVVSDARLVMTGGTLVVSGEMRWRSGIDLSGGLLRANGTGTVLGTLALSSSGDFEVNGAVDVQRLNMAGGDLYGAGAITVAADSSWNAGTMSGTGSITFVGNLTAGGATSRVLSGGRVLNTLGTTRWVGATAANLNDWFNGAGTINNSGLWIDENAFSTAARDWFGGGPVVFNNIGTYRKVGGTTSTLELVFNNTGTLEVNGGALVLARGGSLGGAQSTTNVASGSTLRLTGGLFALQDATVGGAGTLELAGSFSNTVELRQDGTSAVTANLVMNGGTLRANGTLNVNSYQQLDDDSVLSGTGTVNVSGAAVWTDGAMGGTGTINFDSMLALSGNFRRELYEGRVINLRGTTTWSGNAGVNGNEIWCGAGTINNSGTFIDANGFNARLVNWYGGGPLVFNNSGTYRKTGATASTLDVRFNNTGTLDVQAGLLELAAGSTATAANSRFDVSAGATLRFTAGVHTVTGAVLGGLGRYEVTGTFNNSTSFVQSGVTNVAGDFVMLGGTVFANGTLNLNSYQQLDDDAVLSGTGTVNVSGGGIWTDGAMGGTGTINFESSLALSGNARRELYEGRVINLRGTTTWSGNAGAGGNEIWCGAGTINNIGTFVDANAFNARLVNWYSGGPLVFNNSGTYRKTGAATSTLEVRFNNTGILESQAGLLELAAGSTATAANSRFDVSTGATLRFTAGVHTVTGAVLGGLGRYEVTGVFSSTTSFVQSGVTSVAGDFVMLGGTVFANGTLNLNGYQQLDDDAVLSGNGTVNVSGGGIWTDGAMGGTGTINFESSLALSGNARREVYEGRVINLRGITTWSGNAGAGGNEIWCGAGTINNSGTFVDANAFNARLVNWYSGGPLVFNNSGTYRKTGAAASTLEVRFNNTGAVELQAGLLELAASSTATAVNSRFDVSTGATLRFTAGVHTVTGAVLGGLGRYEVTGTFSSTTSFVQSGVTSVAGDFVMLGGTVFANGTLNLNGYQQLDDDSVLTGTGTVNVSGAGVWTDGAMGGTGTINFDSTLALSGNFRRELYEGRVINLRGTTTWSGNAGVNGNEVWCGAGTINNSGTFIDANAFNARFVNWYSGGPAVFNNSGTYRKTGATVSTLDVRFNNTGTVDIQAGSLVLPLGGSSSGETQLAVNARLDLAGGTHSWSSGATTSGAGTLVIAGGSTVLAVSGSISLQRLNLENGALQGTGTVTITGTGSEWRGGSMTGGGTTVIATGADLTIAGSGRKFFGNRTLNVAGTLIDASSGDFVELDGTTTLNINAGGTLDLRSDAGWDNVFGSAGTVTLNNTGTVSRSTGTGLFELHDVALNNNGLVHVKSGVLSIGGDGGTSTGEFRNDAGAETRFVFGTQAWNTGASGTGDGTVALGPLSVTGGTLAVNGTATVQRLDLRDNATLAGTGTLTIQGTGGQWTGGFMTGGGTTTIGATGDLTIAGNGRKFFGNRTLNVAGTMSDASTGEFMELDGTTVLNVNAGGTLDVRSDAGWDHVFGPAGTVTLNNAGTLLRSAGSGRFELHDVALSNSGLVHVKTGVLSIGGDGGTSTGEFRNDAGAETLFVFGTQNWNTGASGTGAGALAVGPLSVTGGTLAVNGTVTVQRLDLRDNATLAGTGTLTIQGTGSQWTGGLMTGGGTTTVGAGGDLTLAGNGRKFFGNRTLNVAGTMSDASTGEFVELDGTTILNVNAGGTLDVRSDAGWDHVFGTAGTVTIHNSGTLSRSTGAGVFELHDVALNNNGLVHVKTGVLSIGGDGGTSIGEFRNDAGAETLFVLGTQTWNTGASGTGAGSVAVGPISIFGGTLAVNGAVNVRRLDLRANATLTGTGTVTIQGTGSQWTGGTMTGGGTTRISAGADLTLAGNGRKGLGNRTIDNRGTLVEASTGDFVELDGAAVLLNAGLMDIRSNTAWGHVFGAAGTLNITNTGTLRKSAGAGDFNFRSASFVNQGVVEVLSGRILINGVPL